MTNQNNGEMSVQFETDGYKTTLSSLASATSEEEISRILKQYRHSVVSSDPRRVPFLLDTDSYKLGHPWQRPSTNSMMAYFTFRGPLVDSDERIVFFGMRYAFETIISHRVQQWEIDEADAYLKTHGVAKSKMSWPRALWQKIVDNGGYIPIRVKSLRDGSVVYPQIPCFTITMTSGEYSDEDFSSLLTWLESSLMRIWSPSTTATKSRHVWQTIREAFDESVEEEFDFLIGSRLHDFGSRGVSSAETAMVTGAGHLLSFDGTDTMTAGWLASKWNNGNTIGESVIASEHSVMTAWSSELEAVKHLIEKTPEGQVLSVVADSYNYSDSTQGKSFLWTILPQIAPLAKAKNILFTVRPDSGDPVKCVLDGLEACDLAFGSVVNSKGYKVLQGAAVIQGDGIDSSILCAIVASVLKKGYSIQNVLFGMGGGLLQKQNRDTLKAAIKLCHMEFADGVKRDVMKKPSKMLSKSSLPGIMTVHDTNRGIKIYPSLSDSWEGYSREADKLEVIWDCGPVGYQFETFDGMRERLNREWERRSKTCKVLSNQMELKLERAKEEILARLEG